MPASLRPLALSAGLLLALAAGLYGTARISREAPTASAGVTDWEAWLAGLPDAETLFQVQARGLRADFPRPRIARRAAPRRPFDDGHAGRPDEGQLELPQPPA